MEGRVLTMFVIASAGTLPQAAPAHASADPGHRQSVVASLDGLEAPQKLGVNRSQIVFDAQKILAPWVKMWNTYDLDQVDQLFVNDARVTYFSSEKPALVRGIEALRAHHAGFGFVPGGKKQASQLSLEGISATVWGDAYVVTATWLFKRGNASARMQRGPVTFVYVPWRGQYRIAHAHFANDPPAPQR